VDLAGSEAAAPRERAKRALDLAALRRIREIHGGHAVIEEQAARNPGRRERAWRDQVTARLQHWDGFLLGGDVLSLQAATATRAGAGE